MYILPSKKEVMFPKSLKQLTRLSFDILRAPEIKLAYN
jgi:hypothetical protein